MAEVILTIRADLLKLKAARAIPVSATRRLPVLVASLEKSLVRRLGRIKVSIFEMLPSKELVPGFWYHISRKHGHNRVWVGADVSHPRVWRLSSRQWAADLVRASMFMLERICWQERLYRGEPRPWTAEMPRTTAFVSLLMSPRGKAESDPYGIDESPAVKELAVTVADCDGAAWGPLANAVGDAADARGVELEDAGYLPGPRCAEFILTGTRAKLLRIVPDLRRLFEGRGAEGRLRAAYSESGGKVIKLGSTSKRARSARATR